MMNSDESDLLDDNQDEGVTSVNGSLQSDLNSASAPLLHQISHEQEAQAMLNSNEQRNTFCGRCWMGFKEEFRKQKYFLRHYRPEDFYTSQWPIPQYIFLTYRVLVALYVDFWLIYTIFKQPSFNGYTWPVFFTNWSYTILALHLTISAICTLVNTQRGGHWCVRAPAIPEVLMEESDPDDAPDHPHVTSLRTQHRVRFLVPYDHDDLTWYMKLDWILYNITLPISIVVTLVFFTLLYPDMPHEHGVDIFNIHVHALNSVFSILELLLCSIPTRLAHIIYPVIYGVIYILFSVFYWVKNHDHVIYEHVLDWNEPGRTLVIVALLALVVLPILQCVMFVLYKLRLGVCKRLFNGLQ